MADITEPAQDPACERGLSGSQIADEVNDDSRTKDSREFASELKCRIGVEQFKIQFHARHFADARFAHQDVGQ